MPGCPILVAGTCVGPGNTFPGVNLRVFPEILIILWLSLTRIS